MGAHLHHHPDLATIAIHVFLSVVLAIWIASLLFAVLFIFFAHLLRPPALY